MDDIAKQIMGIPVSREDLDKLKEQYEKANKTLNQLDQQIDVTTNFIEVSGKVATLVMAACPADGFVGELFTILSTPALIAGIKEIGAFFKDLVKKQKNRINAAIINLTNGKVKMYDIIDNNTVSNLNEECFVPNDKDNYAPSEKKDEEKKINESEESCISDENQEELEKGKLK